MNIHKPNSVENIFNSVAPSYDRLNDLLSLGLHRIWKKQILDLLQPSAGERWLDLCCGTGDMALRLVQLVKPGGSVVGIDSAARPLLIAKIRSKKDKVDNVDWIIGDALNIDFTDNSFDGVILAYGLRNMSDPMKGLKELRRVLLQGGRAGILDFNKFPNETIGKTFQKIYLRLIVVPIAKLFGVREQYSYIEDSLVSFPDGDSLEKMAINAGFSNASYRSIAFGQMGILILT